MPTINEDEDFAIALLTFIELKNHPLIVGVVDYVEQYCLNFFGQSGKVVAVDHLFKVLKINMLSPYFKTKKDAEKAIEDIGEDRLIHMFKTLQGVE